MGTSPDDQNYSEWGIAVVAQNLKVGRGAVVPAKAMITRNVKGDDKKC